MRACLVCSRLTMQTRCQVCQARWEQGRSSRLPQRRAYKDPSYVAYREAVLRLRPRCWLCGMPGADTVDHVVQLAAGGDNRPTNLRPAHRACNSRRRPSE